VVVVGVVAGVAAVLVSRHRDVATAASADDALKRYRDAATGSGGSTIPLGVYTYATTGSEGVSALGGTEHRYPATSTITVTAGGCGPVLRWDVLTNRWTSWTLCRRDDGQTLSAWSEHHQFFGQNNSTGWTCPTATWSTSRPGGDLPLTCRSSGTTESGTTTVEAPETLQVGTTQVPTVHLRTTATETGSARGTVTEDRWLETRTGLPVRLTSTVRTANKSPVGDVTFSETYDLRLTSLEPRR
jgi:hypothetical protein